MKWLNDSKITLLLAVLVLWPAQSPAKEYILTVGNEQLRFVPQAEKGYVVKQPKRTAGISALAGMLFLEEGQVQPIGGLDRHGIWIVENDGPASRNDAVMAELVHNGAAEYAAPLFSSNGETVAVIPEIVVRLKEKSYADELQRLCQDMNLSIKKKMEFTKLEYLIDVLGDDADAVFSAVEQINESPYIEWACLNTASRPKLSGQAVPDSSDSGEQFPVAAAQDANSPGVFPNDEYFPMQWHLHNKGQSGGTPGADIRAPEAWDITTGNPNIVVAVLDSGVDSNHPDLVNNMVPGYDFLDNDAQPDPSLDHPANAHGTMCAGLIAAQGNNGVGVSGATWNCKIMPIRWYRIQSNGTGETVTQADVATAFRWAADQGADILSNSWGWNYNPTPIIHSAIVDVTKPSGIGRSGKGCIVLFSAGNDSSSIKWYPPKYPEVITVGATDHNDVRCYYSDYGPELDIVAPSGPGCTYDDWLNTKGRGWPWTTDISGPAGWNMDPIDPDILDYTGMGGTSGACPIAAGVAALILSVEPNLTGDEVRPFLERSAKDLGAPGRDDYYGWGRVDARAALDMVLSKRADLNDDWKVDFRDFAVLAACWKTDDVRGDIGPIPRPDGAVDVQDLALMGEYWLTEIPDSNLLAHWKLDETEGTIAYDSISNKNGTLYGGPIWQPTGGAINGALQFDGTNDYVSTPFVLNPADSNFSALAWIQGGAPGQVVLSQQSSILLPQGKDWLCADPVTGRLMTALTDGNPSTSPLVSEFIVTDGDWHCIGVTWDGSRRRLYADGVKVAEDSGILANPVSCNIGLNLGAGRNRSLGTFWSGLIDDIRIYDRAITP
jgi:subtilisin family serine protease